MSRRALLILLPILLVLLGPPVLGPTASRADSFDEQAFRLGLQEALELTVAQRDSLRFLRTDLEAELALLREQVIDGELVSGEGRLRYRELLDGYRLARNEILLQDQREMLARAQELAFERRLSEGQAPAPPEHLSEMLDLTLDQIGSWRALLARQRLEVQQLREEGETLQPDDYRRLRELHRIAFESMLTLDQRLKLEQARHQWRSQRLLDELQPDSLSTDRESLFPDDSESGLDSGLDSGEGEPLLPDVPE